MKLALPPFPKMFPGMSLATEWSKILDNWIFCELPDLSPGYHSLEGLGLGRKRGLPGSPWKGRNSKRDLEKKHEPRPLGCGRVLEGFLRVGLGAEGCWQVRRRGRYRLRSAVPRSLNPPTPVLRLLPPSCRARGADGGAAYRASCTKLLLLPHPCGRPA